MNGLSFPPRKSCSFHHPRGDTRVRPCAGAGGCLAMTLREGWCSARGGLGWGKHVSWTPGEGQAPRAVLPSRDSQTVMLGMSANGHGVVFTEASADGGGQGPGDLIQGVPCYAPALWAGHCPSLCSAFIYTMRTLVF